MPQSDQFPPDLHAPPDWVAQVEGRQVSSARWQDGSYGNDAAPSWILIDDSGAVHAQAFYYTPANAERFETQFGDSPYVALPILLDDEIVGSCCVTPDRFTRAVGAAPAGTGRSPADAVQAAVDAASAVPVAWLTP
jgi:hypothetical protein